MFAAVVPKPLAVAFDLVDCFIHVLPLLQEANAGVVANVPTKAAAAMTATIANIVVLFM
jgi:hypothetical protein